jgi:biotin transport system permease protein
VRGVITAYLARRTWLHGVPAGIKLAALAGLSLALAPVDDWRVLALALALVLALYASLGGEAVRRLSALRPLLPLLILIGMIQGATESWAGAAATAARLVLMVLLAELVTMTTTMQGLMDALAPLMRPLRLVGLRPKMLTLAVALVVRFVPVLLARWRCREEAWRARTGRRASLRLVPAFVAETLRLADQVAEALDARGFDGANPGA